MDRLEPSSIFSVVRDCIADSLACPPGEIELESKLLDLGADSLDFVDIAFMLERELAIEVRNSELSFLTKLNFSSPEVMTGGFLTSAVVERLAQWLPLLRTTPDKSRVSPLDLFSMITVEAMCLVVEGQLGASELERES